MANHIVGVDLGAYSVKVLIATPGFRHVAVADFIERPVPPGDEPHEQRALRVLGEIVRERQLQHDSLYLAVTGDQVFCHVLDLPFKTMRRQDLEKAIGGELESVLPIDLEDMVFAFEVVPDVSVVAPPAGLGGGAGLGSGFGGPDEEGPTNVAGGGTRSGFTASGVTGVTGVGISPSIGRAAPPPDGMRVLTCTMHRDRARALIDQVAAQGGEARGLLATPGVYAHLLERVPSLAAARDAGPVAVIDIGHERTDVVVIHQGKPVYTRTLARGGKHLTQAIARTWRLPFDEAERAKHADGFIGSSAEPPATDAWQRVHDVTFLEMGPLARELRQTIATCRARSGAVVVAALMVGGGSRLRGMGSFLGEQLQMPVVVPGVDDETALLGERLAGGGVHLETAARALGAAFDGAAGKVTFDLRSGDLAYKADLSFLRTKAPQLAAALLAVLAFAAIAGYTSLYRLRKAETALQTRLAVETTELFKEPLSADDAFARANGATGPLGATSPIPKLTAYDLLLDFNNRLPDAKTVTLEIDEIEIREGKISVNNASAKSSSEIDAVEAALKEDKCFSEVSTGSTSNGPNGEKKFSLSLKATCL